MPDSAQRLDRIEQTLSETAAVLRTLADSHVATQEALKASIASQTRATETLQEGLRASIAFQTRSTETLQEALNNVAASQVRVHETLAELNTAVAQSVAAADARMRRIEENLDGLIRAITAEHTNGKTKL